MYMYEFESEVVLVCHLDNPQRWPDTHNCTSTQVHTVTCMYYCTSALIEGLNQTSLGLVVQKYDVIAIACSAR